MFKKAILFLPLLALTLGGCAVLNDDEDTLNFSTPVFENVEECDDISAFIAATANNKPDDVGVVISPYYSLKVNNINIPVYASRSGHGVHSYAYVDVDVEEDEKFVLDVDIAPLEECDVVYDDTIVEVLPFRQNVEAEINKKGHVVSKISSFGSFSFIFDEDYIEPITIFVASKINKEELFEDKTIKYILPGDYSAKPNKMVFSDEDQVYYFKSGYYRVDTIDLPSNSVLYLEDGAYITILPNLEKKNSGLSSTEKSNIKIVGRGIIDYSECCGGEESQPMDKSGNIFKDINNIYIQGITIVNSQTWTLCLYNCDNIVINDISLFSYRVFSDGVMLSGCRNALVERNFARTGDDGFETKASGAKRVSENVVFQYNDCWTDKADAYGCVYETDQDIANVTFRHCSVGFAIASWSNHLGCICCQLGNNANDPKTIRNIRFDDIEIYKTENPSIVSLYFGGYHGHYKGYGHIKDIYVSNVKCYKNASVGNTFISFVNHLPEQGASVDKIGTFENINVSNIESNGVLLTSSNYNNGTYVVTSFYEGEGYEAPNVEDILNIRNGEDYE